jgi:hypothetical protein
MTLVDEPGPERMGREGGAAHDEIAPGVRFDLADCIGVDGSLDARLVG